jgi:hypothetical protein
LIPTTPAALIIRATNCRDEDVEVAADDELYSRLLDGLSPRHRAARREIGAGLQSRPP